MCEDCPDGCPVEAPNDSQNKPENEPLTLVPGMTDKNNSHLRGGDVVLYRAGSSQDYMGVIRFGDYEQDGSGGFPLAGVLNGIKPLWASEVEPYCIAVTKSRFKEVPCEQNASK